jgi:signal transduction histidine kinase/type II secretory pathway pseudopilin PulG
MVIESMIGIMAAAAGYGLSTWRTKRRAALRTIADAVASDALEHLQQRLRTQQEEADMVKNEARRLSNIINSSLNPVWQRRAEDFNITYCNLAFSEVAEETTDSVVALGEFELFPGHRELAKKAWETGQEQIEHRHVIVNGERLLYMIREVPFKSDGEIYGWAVNLSELEKAQEEIQRHISAQRDLLESSTSAMAIYGSDRKLKFYNFGFVSLWKLDESWLDTEPEYGEVLELLREKRKLPEQANFQAFKQAQLKQFTSLIEPDEGFFYLPDGKILRVIAIPHALGGVLFVYEDVTDRLALERSYNTLIAVQRETLDHLHEGVVVFGENSRASLSNPVFRKLWDMDEDYMMSEPHLREVINKTQPFFAIPEWDSFCEKFMARVQSRQFFATRFERTDDTVIDCSSVPLPDGATLLTFTDMTDSTLVERSLREKTEALEAADKLKAEFLANMSYELRSPLTSISGFAEMLAQNYLGPLNEKQQEYVGNILQSAGNLGRLIGDIIDLATIEAGYLDISPTDFDPRETIAMVQSLLGERIRVGRAKISYIISDDIRTMHADETRVKQIIFNLLMNAVKFTKSGTAVINLSLTPVDDVIELRVKDNGSGIEASRQSSVFTPFFRGGRGPEANSGLGLSIVKRFTELHGGSVELISEPDVGTEVICRFPLRYGALPGNDTAA